MNILIIVPGGVHSSGEVNIIPALVSLFRQISVDNRVVVVATRQGNSYAEYELFNFTVVSLPADKAYKILSLAKLLKNKLRQMSFFPDVIHSFWLGRPTILASLLSYFQGVPFLASIAGGELVALQNVPYGGMVSLKGRLSMRLNLKLVRASTVGSRYLNEIAALPIDPPPVVVPLGIDTTFWKTREPDVAKNNHWELVKIASINNVKNPWLMLDIVETLKNRKLDFSLHWIGVDTLRKQVHEESTRRGLDKHIYFYGFKTQKEVLAICEGKHFIVQTSYFESQGVAVAEGVSQGLYPVGTAVGWLRDMGMGIELDGRADVCEAICDEIFYITSNENVRKKRVTKLQRWIEENNVSETARKFILLYNELK